MELEVGVAPCAAPKSLAEKLAELRERIAEVARDAGREPGGITLVGVTKKQSRPLVLEALEAGLHDVGENYVQEAVAKLDGLRARKHFIGHVQSNKAKAIVQTFDVVQCIDRLDAGRAIARASRALEKPVTTLVQVNVSPQDRFGTDPSEAAELATRLREEEGLDVDGVMAIGPNTRDRSELERAFSRAAEAFATVGGSTLSLGMSSDWELALPYGSTMLRLGTTLFGPRPMK